jgi:hypothetical protein
MMNMTNGPNITRRVNGSVGLVAATVGKVVAAGIGVHHPGAEGGGAVRKPVVVPAALGS